MSVGLLLITHNDIGSALLATAARILGGCPLRAESLAVTEGSEPGLLLRQAWQLGTRLDTGDGLLVLTDLCGSTPANIAGALTGRVGVHALAGVNLPMLVRVLNYPDLKLAELAQKALSGGRDGVLPCPPFGAGE